ncbi:MAG TPA: ABC transporter ATP-binding protein [Tepidisphaeraceae bacterium]|nr:ABC transporter ATP-binding protein [Tepidisphaeraceae bacterium]
MTSQITTSIEPLLQLSGISVVYTGRSFQPIKALDEVFLTIHSASILAIVGSSGSGKSTLLLSILQLLPVGSLCQGEVLFRGQDLTKLRDKELRSVRGREISLVPQNSASALQPLLTVGAQMTCMFRRVLGMTSRQAQDHAIRWLSRVGAADPQRWLALRAGELSGGMRRRALTATALACGSRLLLADEPTDGLDPDWQAQLINTLHWARNTHGRGAVLVTHDLSFAAQVADRIAVLNAGRIVEEGPCHEVLNHPKHIITAGLVRAASLEQ